MPATDGTTQDFSWSLNALDERVRPDVKPVDQSSDLVGVERTASCHFGNGALTGDLGKIGLCQASA